MYSCYAHVVKLSTYIVCLCPCPLGNMCNQWHTLHDKVYHDNAARQPSQLRMHNYCKERTINCGGPPDRPTAGDHQTNLTSNVNTSHTNALLNKCYFMPIYSPGMGGKKKHHNKPPGYYIQPHPLPRGDPECWWFLGIYLTTMYSQRHKEEKLSSKFIALTLISKGLARGLTPESFMQPKASVQN